jgi:hypothetical protein
MTMTPHTETSNQRKRGRPFGSFGPKRRQQELTAQFIDQLGGDAKITPVQEMDIARAVALISFAEESRRQITKYGAQSVQDLSALVRLEDCADRAVRRLKLPVSAINTGVVA